LSGQVCPCASQKKIKKNKMGNIPYAEQIGSLRPWPFFQLPSKMEIFCGPKKMMPLLFSLTFSHENIPDGSRDFMPFFQLPYKNGKFVVQKNDAIFILSGLDLVRKIFQKVLETRESRVSGKTGAILVETRNPHSKMESRMSLIGLYPTSSIP
jgi:hypothetical protein